MREYQGIRRKDLWFVNQREDKKRWNPSWKLLDERKNACTLSTDTRNENLNKIRLVSKSAERTAVPRDTLPATSP